MVWHCNILDQCLETMREMTGRENEFLEFAKTFHAKNAKASQRTQS